MCSGDDCAGRNVLGMQSLFMLIYSLLIVIHINYLSFRLEYGPSTRDALL